MDIENMHPFCLPFSLCHDATSSSITEDLGSTLLHNKDNDKSNKSGNNNNINSNNIEKSRSRLKGATSPIEDLFNRFDASLSPPSNRSLLHDDCLIDSSSAYNALHLDIDMVTNLNDHHDTCASEFGLNDDEDTNSLCKNDDWFSTTTTTHDCSLFSPIDSITNSLTKQRKYLKGAFYSALNNNNNQHHHHQVFHVVDPIDIKSSPTLAQLNLNSNDDPTDNLWDTTSSNAPATLSISTRAQTPNLSSDLLSSCISSAQTSSCVNNNTSLTTCNHPIHNQQANNSATPYATHQGNSQLSPLCHQLYHHHHHHNHMGTNGRSISSQTQSTCLAVTPFRKSVDLQRTIINNHPTCCMNHHHHGQGQNYHGHSQSYLGNSSIASQQANCPNLQKLASATNSHCNSSEALAPRQQLTTAIVDNHQRHQHQQQQQQHKSQHPRCSSPAPLVTSSSSPLSSSLAQNLPNDSRLTDNKLKENIEYLTVLLCSGNNKLDKQTNNQQQQSSISSTIVKSYSTLAQSLSTEPKLLEKYQQQQLNHHSNNNNNNNSNSQQSTPNSLALNNQHIGLACDSRPLSTNEASPQSAVQMNTQPTNISNVFSSQDGGAKKMSHDQWFRSTTIESSVSAADSTAENQLLSNNDRPLAMRGNVGVPLNGCLNYPHNHPTTAGMPAELTPVSRQNEMKVLSSLLNSNLGRSLPQTDSALIAGNPQMNNCATWRTSCNQNLDIQNHIPPTLSQTLGHQRIVVSNESYTANQQVQHPHQQISSNTQYNQDSNSIPPNGRPITLTPLVSNNVIIPQRNPPPQIRPQPQQQPQQQPSIKSKAPTFVQPASPSASSTTSSSGNTDIGSSSATAAVPAKRQKAGDNNNQTKPSDRSARPNSLSTECSLSSHDEGFSSQIDQDDCMNSMQGDSDDDSDIDSDDESFYGDYTNSDLIGASISDNPDCKWTLTMGRTRRNGQKRFFWQYNVQSKGPKGTRISSADGSENPFVLPEASDPVFSNDCQIEGVKHSGKARRGDGNDLTPNPKKLLMIGLELKKLSKIINDLAPVTDLPMNARNKTRKEKNKLASRACRLKKKAQHEANKIKLYGLQREHQQVVMAIYDIRKLLRESLAQDHIKQESLKDRKLGTYVKTLVDQCSMTVAGKTGDYVNSVLEKVVSGFIDGGL